MLFSRRIFFTFVGGVMTLASSPPRGIAAVRAYLEGWDDIQRDFASYCPSDLYTLRSPSKWTGVSPHYRANGYLVHVRSRAPWPMTAAEYYRHLKGLRNWSEIDRDLEIRLRTGTLLRIDYSYEGGSGNWRYAFKDEASYFDYVAVQPDSVRSLFGQFVIKSV